MSLLLHIDHVNIVTRDLDAMVRYYRDILGFAVTKEVRIQGDWIEKVVALKNVDARVVFLELPSGPRIELLQYLSPAGTHPPGLELPHTQGLRHIAFKVDDIEKAYADLVAKGVQFLGTPQVVATSQVTFTAGATKHLVYFHDPEGTLLELCEYRTA